jgi:hypothetical protein
VGIAVNGQNSLIGRSSDASDMSDNDVRTIKYGSTGRLGVAAQLHGGEAMQGPKRRRR